MLKIVSVALPEKMIEEIDEILLTRKFGSRSDFFRHIVRVWQNQNGEGSMKPLRNLAGQDSSDIERRLVQPGAVGAKDIRGEGNEDIRGKLVGEERPGEFDDVDCEFGIPAEVVERIYEIVKSKT